MDSEIRLQLEGVRISERIARVDGLQAAAGETDVPGACVPTSPAATAEAAEALHALDDLQAARSDSERIARVNGLQAATSGTEVPGACVPTSPATTVEAAQALHMLDDLHATPAVQRGVLLLDFTELADDARFQITDAYSVATDLLGVGSGKGVVVRKATHRTTGEQVAIKEIPTIMMAARQEETMRREIEIMTIVTTGAPARLGVIRLYAVVETARAIYMVMELAQGGELFDHIVDTEGYDERKARQVMRQILEAVQYLHRCGVVHRDIKTDNILCSDQQGIGIKIADFGLANRVATNIESDEGELNSLLESKCGTPLYMAPEMLLRHPYNSSVDMWSVGIVMYNILSGSMPFFAETEEVRRTVRVASVCVY